MTIYIYSNDTDEMIDSFDGASSAECEAWAMEFYDINDYYFAYTSQR